MLWLYVPLFILAAAVGAWTVILVFASTKQNVGRMEADLLKTHDAVVAEEIRKLRRHLEVLDKEVSRLDSRIDIWRTRAADEELKVEGLLAMAHGRVITGPFPGFYVYRHSSTGSLHLFTRFTGSPDYELISAPFAPPNEAPTFKNIPDAIQATSGVTVELLSD